MSTPFWKAGLSDATADIEAIIEIAGGLTAVAVHLKTSPQTVSAIRDAGRVTNTVFAIRMAELAAIHGRPEITIHRLGGVAEQPLLGDASPTGRRRRGPNGSSPRANLAAVPPTGGGTEAGSTARLAAKRQRARKVAHGRAVVRPQGPNTAWTTDSLEDVAA